MYIKNIILENCGPIKELNYSFPFDNDGNPKPVVIVGQNGSGKSIFLSHVVNSLINAKQFIFEDSEVEKGKVYKHRTSNYIKVNEQYYFVKIEFESNIETVEWQLHIPRSEFEKTHNQLPHQAELSYIPQNATSVFRDNYHNNTVNKEILESILNHNCMLYFPANRFEEPAWLNYKNLLARANYSDANRIQGFSNRNIIQYSSLSENKNWLLDLIFDQRAFEAQIQDAMATDTNGAVVPIQIHTGYTGKASSLYNSVLEILQLILKTKVPIRFGYGERKNRQVTLQSGDKLIVPNIFQLSTGEALLLNLFLSILRDFDLTKANFEGLNNLRGIVIIDEIDVHLHSDLQFKVLPSLIKRFPKVQFIITSHSPLFLLGLQKELSDDGFSILSLPDGNEIGVERFAEFQTAYDFFTQTTTYQNDLAFMLKKAEKNIVFVEGDYDIRYIKKAAELLEKNEILNSIQLSDGGGFGNLNNIWKSLDTPLSSVLPKKILLIYDCDIEKSDAIRNNIVKKIMPSVSKNPIKKGVENLFSQETIEKVMNQNPQFIDVTEETKKIVRGKEMNVPKSFSTNLDEKGNLCNWLCENGTRHDFENFERIFNIIDGFLKRE